MLSVVAGWAVTRKNPPDSNKPSVKKHTKALPWRVDGKTVFDGVIMVVRKRYGYVLSEKQV
jgi:hypothetical protein